MDKYHELTSKIEQTKKELDDLYKQVKELKAKDKPYHFTNEEKIILRNLPEEYKYIARDKYDNRLYIYDTEPNKISNYWFASRSTKFDMFDHIFKCIKYDKACEFRKYLEDKDE